MDIILMGTIHIVVSLEHLIAIVPDHRFGTVAWAIDAVTLSNY